ncbi:TPA: hypothetical protein G9C53_005062, partial [Salmonella enterica subsp. enterica serovar Typhimurium var. 5-]|nr:hypothetical protein [Salmonella enterica subsp. enterica serovar Typhimurium var. 5-]
MEKIPFPNQLDIKSKGFQPLIIEGICIDDYLDELKTIKTSDKLNDRKDEIDSLQEKINNDIEQLNKSFIVKSYKLIIRDTLEIDDVESKVKAQSHKFTHTEFVNCKEKDASSSYSGF